MSAFKKIGKREFIQHTSLYLKKAESNGILIITHQNKPVLKIMKIKEKSIKDLKGLITFIKINGDINEQDLPGYDQW